MATATDNRRANGRAVLGVGVAVVLLGALFVSLDIDAILRALADADLRTVGLAAAASLAAQLCWSLTTAMILEGVDGSLPRGRVQLGYLSGTFGKQVLPLGNAGGSAILAYVIAEDLDRRFREVFPAVTASELLVFAGSIGVAAMGLGAMLVDPYAGVPGWVVLTLLTASVVVLVGGGAVLAYRRHVVASLVETTAALVRATVGRVSTRVHRGLAPGRVSNGTARFLESFGAATGDTRRVTAASVLAVVGWLCFSLALFYGLAAVGVAVSLGLALFLTPASGVVTLLPTPGGLGTTELGLTAFVTVLTTAPPELVAAGVILYRLVTYWLVVAVGGLASVYLSATVWHALD
jgi:uncharacterized protein (TIRG00374 family)